MPRPRMRFTVYIEPKPKPRPRMNMKTGRVYTPAKCHSYQNEIRDAIVRHLGIGAKYPIFGVDVPLAVDVDFVSNLPNSHEGNRKKGKLGPHWRPVGDDIDNLAKAVWDGLNGILWEDDRQIVETRMRKLYASRKRRDGEEDIEVDADERPRICISVRPVDEEPLELCGTNNPVASEYWTKD